MSRPDWHDLPGPEHLESGLGWLQLWPQVSAAGEALGYRVEAGIAGQVEPVAVGWVEAERVKSDDGRPEAVSRGWASLRSRRVPL